MGSYAYHNFHPHISSIQYPYVQSRLDSRFTDLHKELSRVVSRVAPSNNFKLTRYIRNLFEALACQAFEQDYLLKLVASTAIAPTHFSSRDLRFLEAQETPVVQGTASGLLASGHKHNICA